MSYKLPHDENLPPREDEIWRDEGLLSKLHLTKENIDYMIKNNILKYAYPNRVMLVKYNNQTITDNFLTSVVTFIFAFIFLFIFISTLLSVIGLDFVTAISGAATSISNVGPGLGDLIGPDGNFSNLPDAALWIISVGMLLGRLELFAVLILLFPSFWRG